MITGDRLSFRYPGSTAVGPLGGVVCGLGRFRHRRRAFRRGEIDVVAQPQRAGAPFHRRHDLRSGDCRWVGAGRRGATADVPSRPGLSFKTRSPSL